MGIRCYLLPAVHFKEQLSCQSHAHCIAPLGHFHFAVVSYFGIGVILMISYPLSTLVRIAWGCDLKTTSMTSVGSEPWRPTGTVFSYRMQSLWHAHSPELFHLLSQQLLKMAKLLLEKISLLLSACTRSLLIQINF